LIIIFLFGINNCFFIILINLLKIGAIVFCAWIAPGLRLRNKPISPKKINFSLAQCCAMSAQC